MIAYPARDMASMGLPTAFVDGNQRNRKRKRGSAVATTTRSRPVDSTRTTNSTGDALSEEDESQSSSSESDGSGHEHESPSKQNRNDPNSTASSTSSSDDSDSEAAGVIVRAPASSSSSNSFPAGFHIPGADFPQPPETVVRALNQARALTKKIKTQSKDGKLIEKQQKNNEQTGSAQSASASDSHSPSLDQQPKSKQPSKKKRKKQQQLLADEADAELEGHKAAAASHQTDLKYWMQRYSLFSRFDEGCKLDPVGWFSVTPELIAIHQAERCRCDVIIDAFAGVGGNAIQFAQTCSQVIAIEIDPHRLELARHNAKVYGVDKRIEFICGNYLELIPKLKADVVFLAPPWGGVDYTNVEHFDIEHMISPNGFDIFRRTLAITRNIAYCLPRNIRPQQLQEMATLTPVPADSAAAAAATTTTLPSGSSAPYPPLACELEENCVRGKVKMMTAYFGDLVNLQPAEDQEQLE